MAVTPRVGQIDLIIADLQKKSGAGYFANNRQSAIRMLPIPGFDLGAVLRRYRAANFVVIAGRERIVIQILLCDPWINRQAASIERGSTVAASSICARSPCKPSEISIAALAKLRRKSTSSSLGCGRFNACRQLTQVFRQLNTPLSGCQSKPGITQLP